MPLIVGDSIVDVGQLDVTGAEVTEAAGLIVAPGFIDVHSLPSMDVSVPRDPAAHNGRLSRCAWGAQASRQRHDAVPNGQLRLGVVGYTHLKHRAGRGVGRVGKRGQGALPGPGEPDKIPRGSKPYNWRRGLKKVVLAHSAACPESEGLSFAEIGRREAKRPLNCALRWQQTPVTFSCRW